MSRVWVKEVSPINLHGFKGSQLVLRDLEEGLNLVFASNATGKSTLAKSILSLFQPDQLDEAATVTGTLDFGNGLESRSARKKDGILPGFPGRAKDYYLDLPSLLEGLGKESGVEQILGPGYRLPEPVKLARSDNSIEVKQARQALTNVQQARAKKQAIASEEERLPELLAEVQEAEQARENVRALSELVRQKGLSSERAQILTSIEELDERFPGLVHQGVQAEGELEAKVKESNRIADELRDLNELLNRLGQSGSPARELLASEETLLKGWLDNSKRSAGVLSSLAARLSVAEKRLESESRLLFRLAPDEDFNALPELTRVHYADLAHLAREADVVRARQTEASAFAKVLNNWPNDSPLSSEELDRVQRKLADWLNWEPESTAIDRRLEVILLVCAALGAGLVPVLLVRTGAIVLAIVAAAIYFFRKPPAAKEVRPPLGDLPSQFACPNPNPDLVAEKLQLVASYRGRAQVRKDLELLANAAQTEIIDLDELVRESGLKCSDPYALSEVVRTIENYQEAYREVAELRSEIEFHQSSIRQVQDELGRFYQGFGFIWKEGSEPESAADFNQWLQRHATRRRLTHQAAVSENDLSVFLHQQGLPASEDLPTRIQSFRDRIGPANALADLKQKLRDLGTRLDSVQINWPAVHSCLKLEKTTPVEEIELGAIQSEIERQESLAKELDNRRANYESLKAEIRKAENEHSLANAEVEYRRSLVHVERRWEEASRDSVRSRISSAIRQRLMTEDLPPLLQGANQTLDRFSIGRYQLEFGDQKDDQIANLTVADRFTGRKQPFRELSSGTKVHCLLALKLSLISAQEENANLGLKRFPLIADEPMAVSDHDSSRAIAEALIEVAKTRQVIVFTSQVSDVDLFKKLVPGLEERTLHPVPLEFSVELPSTVPRTRLAPIGTLFDARHPVGAQSVGALFGASRIDASHRIDQGQIDPALAKAASRLEGVRLELDQNHPRLVWDACKDQKWANTAFSSNLRDFLDRHRGCPHRFLLLVEGSRGKAFNKNQVDEAKEWLEANGYLAPIPALGDLERLIGEALEDRPVTEAESAIRAFAEAFIPDFDPQEWAYIAPQKRSRSKRSEPEYQTQGLFEEL